MKILTVLTYYRPHTSGLTIYAERLARAFVKRGHQVTVMTSQYDPSLLLEETLDGVKIIRVPVVARISKGVIAPTFGWVATKLAAGHDVIQMHLPQFDAPGVALRGRLLRKPAVLTYHCDLLLPPGFFNRFVNAVVDFQNNMAGILSNHIVTYTQDYADHSPYLSRYASKLTPILPPVELPKPLPGAVRAFAEEHHVQETTSCHWHGGALRGRKGSGGSTRRTASYPEEISESAGFVRRGLSKCDGRTGVFRSAHAAHS